MSMYPVRYSVMQRVQKVFFFFFYSALLVEIQVCYVLSLRSVAHEQFYVFEITLTRGLHLGVMG